MNPLKNGVLWVSLLLAGSLVGCASETPAPEMTVSKPAPAPSNLTPDQKQAYERALKQSGPPK